MHSNNFVIDCGNEFERFRGPPFTANVQVSIVHAPAELFIEDTKQCWDDRKRKNSDCELKQLATVRRVWQTSAYWTAWRNGKWIRRQSNIRHSHTVSSSWMNERSRLMTHTCMGALEDRCLHSLSDSGATCIVECCAMTITTLLIACVYVRWWQAYWDSRYLGQDEPYEWYFDWPQIRPLVTQHTMCMSKKRLGSLDMFELVECGCVFVVCACMSDSANHQRGRRPSRCRCRWRRSSITARSAQRRSQRSTACSVSCARDWMRKLK